MFSADAAFSFNGNTFVVYRADLGEGLPLHDHTFNHITIVLEGEIEVSDGAAVSVVLNARNGPIEYRAGRKHAITAKQDGTRFMNVSPTVG